MRGAGVLLAGIVAGCNNCAHYGPDAVSCDSDRRTVSLATGLAALPLVAVAGGHVLDRAPVPAAPKIEPAVTYAAAGYEVALQTFDPGGDLRLTAVMPFGPGMFAFSSGGLLPYPSARVAIFDAATQTRRWAGPAFMNFFPLAAVDRTVIGYGDDGSRLAVKADGTVTTTPQTGLLCSAPRISQSGRVALCGTGAGLQSLDILSASPLAHLAWNDGEHWADYAVADDGTIVMITAREAVARYSDAAFGKFGPRIKAAAVALAKGPDRRLRLAAIALTPDGTAARAMVFDAASGRMLFEGALGTYASGTILVARTGRIAFVSRELLVIDPQGAGYTEVARLREPSAYLGRMMAWDESGAWLLLGLRQAQLLHISAGK